MDWSWAESSFNSVAPVTGNVREDSQPICHCLVASAREPGSSDQNADACSISHTHINVQTQTHRLRICTTSPTCIHVGRMFAQMGVYLHSANVHVCTRPRKCTAHESLANGHTSKYKCASGSGFLRGQPVFGSPTLV